MRALRSRTRKRWAQSPRARSIRRRIRACTVRKSAIMPRTVPHGPGSACSMRRKHFADPGAQTLVAADQSFQNFDTAGEPAPLLAQLGDGIDGWSSRLPRARRARAVCRREPGGQAARRLCKASSAMAKIAQLAVDGRQSFRLFGRTRWRSRWRSRWRLSTWALEATASFCKCAARRICSRCWFLSALTCSIEFVEPSLTVVCSTFARASSLPSAGCSPLRLGGASSASAVLVRLGEGTEPARQLREPAARRVSSASKSCGERAFMRERRFVRLDFLPDPAKRASWSRRASSRSASNISSRPDSASQAPAARPAGPSRRAIAR